MSNENVNRITVNTPLPLPPPHPEGVTGVEGVILAELKYIRQRVDIMASQVAVHESKLDTGNKSEKASAMASVISCLIAVISLIIATVVIDSKANDNDKSNVVRPSDRMDHIYRHAPHGSDKLPELFDKD